MGQFRFNPGTPCWLHDLNEVLFALDTPDAAATFTLKAGLRTHTLTLRPDAGGDEIYLNCIPDLVRAMVSEYGAPAVTITITGTEDGCSPDSVTFTAITARVRTTARAAEFAAGHWLTCHEVAAKVTYAGAVEYLTAYVGSGDPSTPVVTAYTYDPATGTAAQTIIAPPLTRAGLEGGAWRWMLSVADVLTEAGSGVYGFRVALGARVQEYRIAAAKGAPATSVQYVNGFGALDTFHFFGAVEATPSAEREEAVYADGTHALLSATDTTEYTAHTGELPDRVPLLDLLLARNVTAMDGTELILTGGDTTLSNAYGEQLTGIVTWRLAKPGTRYTPRAVPDTFPDTFDNSFL